MAPVRWCCDNPTLAHRCREGAIHPIMAGLGPATHEFPDGSCKVVGGRAKPGHLTHGPPDGSNVSLPGIRAARGQAEPATGASRSRTTSPLAAEKIIDGLTARAIAVRSIADDGMF